MHLNKNITLVEVVWSGDKISQNYISRLNKYLNPYSDWKITTAMWNKEVLPGIAKTNTYSRFMIVFDYDEHKLWQRCFSYSSPKYDDTKMDLRYYILPNRQKIMLNSSIDIPSKYLIRANFEQMKKNEKNVYVLKNIESNIENLKFVKQFKDQILEQYEVIDKNIWTNPKFHQNNVKWAHERIINNKKQHEFCMNELELIKQQELLIAKTKENQSGGSSGAPSSE